MPKRKPRTSVASPRTLIALGIGAVALFLLGEAFVFARSDSSRIFIARTLGIGDRARITQIVSRHVRQAFQPLGLPADSVVESVAEGGPAALRWRIGFPPDASLLEANHAITRRVEELGARVLSGRERLGKHGESIVTLLVGLPRLPTHELVLVRTARTADEASLRAARLALVVYGFGDDPAFASAFSALHVPFAMAVVPGGPASAAILRAAHGSQREVVLHLPLEPINYPQVNPGPGAVLVTMKPPRIAALVNRYLAQARPLTAVANHMGSLATQDMTVMTAIYRELKRADLPFIHVAPAAGSVCKPLASDLGVAYDEPDAVIDGEAKTVKPKALEQRWKEILQRARGRDRMVVWLRATPLTRAWLPGAVQTKKLEGVQLVPLSSVIRRPAGI
jgi:polysaccharide deacetylase 2 family uncharacterized protein YibQ